MATIPQVVARRSLDIGNVVQYPTSDPVGAALEKSGDQLSNLVTRFQARKEQQERFDALIGFDGLSSSLAGDVDVAKQTMQPGARGLHDKLLENYDKKTQEWLVNVPDSHKKEFEARIRAKREAYSVQAANLELLESNRHETEGVTKRLDVAKQGLLQNPDALPNFKRDVEELINSTTLGPVQREELRKASRRELERTALISLHKRDPAAADQIAAKLAGGVGSVVDRIIGVESGGNATATNRNSTATGAGQFIDQTWIETLQKHRPELVQGRDRAAVLALRNDPKLSREMTARYAEENATRLRRSDIATTPANIYLAHFLGPGDAIKVLSISGDNAISSVVSQKVIDANPVLQGKTVGQVVAWAQKKMGGAAGQVDVGDPRFSNLTYEDVVTVSAAAQQDQASRRAQAVTVAEKEAKARSDEYMREAFSRMEKNELTSEFVESVRPHVSPTEYKNLLAGLREDAPANDAEAIVDLTRRIDTTNPDEFQRIAGQYLEQKKLKLETYVQMSEKNRSASKDDQPASPYKSGRALVNTTLDPGQLLSGPAAAIGRNNQAQALTEFDNWAAANPRSDRAEATAQAQEIIKRYQIVPYDEMKLAVGTSPYFGNKARNEIKAEDIQNAEALLFQHKESGALSKEQVAFEIRRLQSWREILAKQKAAEDAATKANKSK